MPISDYASAFFFARRTRVTFKDKRRARFFRTATSFGMKRRASLFGKKRCLGSPDASVETREMRDFALPKIPQPKKQKPGIEPGFRNLSFGLAYFASLAI
jgi:hypothetical protein